MLGIYSITPLRIWGPHSTVPGLFKDLAVECGWREAANECSSWHFWSVLQQTVRSGRVSLPDEWWKISVQRLWFWELWRRDSSHSFYLHFINREKVREKRFTGEVKVELGLDPNSGIPVWVLSPEHHGFPRWLSGRESACQCRRCKFHPWVRKIP